MKIFWIIAMLIWSVACQGCQGEISDSLGAPASSGAPTSPGDSSPSELAPVVLTTQHALVDEEGKLINGEANLTVKSSLAGEESMLPIEIWDGRFEAHLTLPQGEQRLSSYLEILESGRRFNAGDVSIELSPLELESVFLYFTPAEPLNEVLIEGALCSVGFAPQDVWFCDRSLLQVHVSLLQCIDHLKVNVYSEEGEEVFVTLDLLIDDDRVVVDISDLPNGRYRAEVATRSDRGDVSEDEALAIVFFSQLACDQALEEPVGEEPVGEEPVGEEPVGEDPVGEEPVDEEPVGEEPVGEEPVGEVLELVSIDGQEVLNAHMSIEDNIVILEFTYLPVLRVSMTTGVQLSSEMDEGQGFVDCTNLNLCFSWDPAIEMIDYRLTFQLNDDRQLNALLESSDGVNEIVFRVDLND